MVRPRALAIRPTRRRSALLRTLPEHAADPAHAARGFNPQHTILGIGSLRGLGNVWFDTAASPTAAPSRRLSTVRHQRVLYGSDFPVSHLRGRCVGWGTASCGFPRQHEPGGSYISQPPFAAIPRQCPTGAVAPLCCGPAALWQAETGVGRSRALRTLKVAALSTRLTDSQVEDIFTITEPPLRCSSVARRARRDELSPEPEGPIPLRYPAPGARQRLEQADRTRSARVRPWGRAIGASRHRPPAGLHRPRAEQLLGAATAPSVRPRARACCTAARSITNTRSPRRFPAALHVLAGVTVVSSRTTACTDRPWQSTRSTTTRRYCPRAPEERSVPPTCQHCTPAAGGSCTGRAICRPGTGVEVQRPAGAPAGRDRNGRTSRRVPATSGGSGTARGRLRQLGGRGRGSW